MILYKDKEDHMKFLKILTTLGIGFLLLVIIIAPVVIGLWLWLIGYTIVLPGIAVTYATISLSYLLGVAYETNT